MDCVLGYHMNPLTCGIAKFNQQLARELDVPILNVFSPEASCYSKPLLSIKTSEFDAAHLEDLGRFLDTLRADQSLRLFFHAYTGTELEQRLVDRANFIYCGNEELYRQLQPFGDKVVCAWCPGTLLDRTPFHDAQVSILTFGMAHKLRPEYYHKLDRLLQATGKSYCLYVSTALHEGTTFETDFLDVFEEMKLIFSGEVYFLGFLSDTAVYNYLKDTSYLAAFFPQAVRANNTSVNTAIELGATVITNLDESSPSQFRHMHSVVDIEQCEDLPTDKAEIARIGASAQQAARDLGWQPLVALIKEQEALQENQEKAYGATEIAASAARI